MKQFSLFSLLLAAAMSFTVLSCTSREEKVAETIKNEMFKTLYDFESYQPIETKIDTLKCDRYGDTLIYDKFLLACVMLDKLKEVQKEFDSQKEIAELYTPTYYSSTYNDKKFEDARTKMGEAIDQMESYLKAINSMQSEIRALAKQCDGKQYGWLVTHKYRCKTKGGNPTISTEYYFMDNDCERIIRSFDKDDMTLEYYKSGVDSMLEESEDDDNKKDEE